MARYQIDADRSGRIGGIAGKLNFRDGSLTSIWHFRVMSGQMASPFYTAEHEVYREVVRRFVEKEIEPYANHWDEAGRFPRELCEKAAAIGLLGKAIAGSIGSTLSPVTTPKAYGDPYALFGQQASPGLARRERGGQGDEREYDHHD